MGEKLGGVECEILEDPPLRGQSRRGDRGLLGCGAATRQALEVRARGLRRAGGGTHPPTPEAEPR